MPFGIRTYLPSLYSGVSTLHRYGTRYQAKIEAGLTAPQITCFRSLITALADCLAILTPPSSGA